MDSRSNTMFMVRQHDMRTLTWWSNQRAKIDFDPPYQRRGGIWDQFDNCNLSVMSVITDDEAKINALFVRLNRSKPLTGAEIRNAMTGKVPGLARKLAGHPFFQKNIRFKIGRGQDRNLAAKLLLL